MGQTQRLISRQREYVCACSYLICGSISTLIFKNQHFLYSYLWHSRQFNIHVLCEINRIDQNRVPLTNTNSGRTFSSLEISHDPFIIPAFLIFYFMNITFNENILVAFLQIQLINGCRNYWIFNVRLYTGFWRGPGSQARIICHPEWFAQYNLLFSNLFLTSFFIYL